VAELCFNTAMTGYQEIMTDPSYAGQIVTFTFPHIGNVGVNPEDDETADPGGRGHGGEMGPDGAVELARDRGPRRTGWSARAASASAGSTRGA
jgi:carbamoyl-phosphate synthase small subunit